MRISAIVRVCCLVLLCATHATGYQSLQNAIPNGNRIPHPCIPNQVWEGVGHQAVDGGGPRNPFGLAFKAAGTTWTRALCLADSDGDGASNGAELGDPNCIWTPGQTPQVTDQSLLRHPGVCEPLNSPNCTARNNWAISCQKFDCPAFSQTGVMSRSLQFNRTAVPNTETNFYCMTFDLPADQDYHMVGMVPEIDNKQIMHHMLMYACDDTAPKVESPETCDMARPGCQSVIYVWAVGLQGECVNENAGFRMGLTGVKRVMLEYHWNNPLLETGHFDATGLRIYYTPNLRPNDAGIFWTGQLDLMIPPHRQRMVFNATCDADCTRNALKGPIYFTTGFNHMHYLGIAQTVELFRGGQRIEYLTNETHFDYNSPTVFLYDKPIEIRPGDELRTTCVYQSKKRRTTTFFGDATADEMCFAFFQYYPKLATNIDQCVNFRELNFCDMQEAGVLDGCRFFDMLNNSHPQTKALMDKVLDSCHPSQGCNEECPDVLEEVSKDPCLTGTIGDYLKLSKTFTDDIKDVRFLAALQSCDRKKTDHGLFPWMYPSGGVAPVTSLLVLFAGALCAAVLG